MRRGPRSRATARSAFPAARALRIEVLRGGRWAPGSKEIGTWARAALGRRAPGHELAVRVVDARESRKLNARYRGQDHATNVLSFPVSTPHLPATVRPLGDLVICPAVVRAEARRQGKQVRAHWAHLIVHGTLHLIGYDHEQPRDAHRMERREITVLKRLGFANPYRSA